MTVLLITLTVAAMRMSSAFTAEKMSYLYKEVLHLSAGQMAAQVTFSKNVAPILYSHCVVCHRPNDIAPIVPPERRGEGLGLYGFIVNVPAGADVTASAHGRAPSYPNWNVKLADVRETARYFDTANFVEAWR